MSSRAPRLTGLQRQVLHLYRDVLRLARSKNSGQQAAIITYARAEVERYRDADRKNYQLIEHLIRKGRKQLALVSRSDVTGVRLKLR